MSNKSADNIRNVWPAKQAQWIEEGRRLEREEQHRMKIVADHVNELSKLVMLSLATIPFEKWPEFAKIAHRHLRQDAPNRADIWKDHHDKMTSKFNKDVA